MKLNSDTLLSFGVFGLGLVAIGSAGWCPFSHESCS